jgi:hypothetical protein
VRSGGSSLLRTTHPSLRLSPSSSSLAFNPLFSKSQHVVSRKLTGSRKVALGRFKVNSQTTSRRLAASFIPLSRYALERALTSHSVASLHRASNFDMSPVILFGLSMNSRTASGSGSCAASSCVGVGLAVASGLLEGLFAEAPPLMNKNLFRERAVLNSLVNSTSKPIGSPVGFSGATFVHPNPVGGRFSSPPAL